MTSLRAQKSTTVRSLTAAALRGGLGALWAVAPGAAARVATRHFLTPPRARAARGGAAFPGAEPGEVRLPGGERLRIWQLGAGPAVLLVHGWGGRSGQLAALATALAGAGATAVALDGPAHGASDGRVASLVHFAEAVLAAARATGARAAIGHSLGGAAVAVAASRGLRLDAAVVIGSPRGPEGFFSAYAGALGIEGARREALRAALERRVGVPMAALDLAALAPAAPPPLLVVHDRADREVPFADGEVLAASWAGARLLATDGLGHRRILRAPAVVSAASDFVSARLARCGCGCGRLAAEPGPEGRCTGCAVAEDLWARERRRALAAHGTARADAPWPRLVVAR